MIDYQFNKYRVTKEDATAWSYNAYQLCRTEAGLLNGQQAGEILYMAKVKGESFEEIRKAFSFAPAQIVKGVIRGRYAPEAFYYFNKILNNESEMLELLFKVTTTKKGEM